MNTKSNRPVSVGRCPGPRRRRPPPGRTHPARRRLVAAISACRGSYSRVTTLLSGRPHGPDRWCCSRRGVPISRMRRAAAIPDQQAQEVLPAGTPRWTVVRLRRCRPVRRRAPNHPPEQRIQQFVDGRRVGSLIALPSRTLLALLGVNDSRDMLHLDAHDDPSEFAECRRKPATVRGFDQAQVVCDLVEHHELAQGPPLPLRPAPR